MDDEVKKARSVTKRKVTNQIRKLTSSLQYETKDKIDKEADCLNVLFDELCSLHMEYEELSGIKDNDYLAEITVFHETIFKEYYVSVKNLTG